MSRQRHNIGELIQWVVRPLLGIIVTAIYFEWLRGKDLQGGLFPSLYLTGLITSIVAGLPLGWMLTAGYILVRNDIFRVLVDAVFFGQVEAPIFLGAFAGVAIAGGVSGWGITMFILWILRVFQ